MPPTSHYSLACMPLRNLCASRGDIIAACDVNLWHTVHGGDTIAFPLVADVVPPVRPSGLVLSRPDYYTVPSLEEIDSLVAEGEGESVCMVEGFTVGRRGFGQVHFPGKTDVYGFNLDELGVFAY